MAEENSVFIYTEGVVVPEDVVRVRVHPSVTIIPEKAFSDCNNLVEVELCDGLVEIGKEAFKNCEALKQMSIPSTVTKIHSYSFQYCDALETIELYDGLLEIGKQAFDHCISLKSISIPSTVNFIGDRAFYETQILSISLPDGVQNIEEFALCRTQVLKFRLPPLITSIPSGLFSVCTYMLSLELSENIEDIEIISFNLTCSLRNLAIPLDANFPAFPSNVFSDCIDLEQLFGSVPNIINALKHRFDGLPIHKMLYYQSYNNMTVDQLNNATNVKISRSRSKPDPTSNLQDSLGMTPLHIMACSTKQDLDLYRILIDKYPETLVTEDSWGAIPLLYALWGDAPSEIVWYLVESYQSLYPNHELNWTEMVKTLAKDAPLKVIQRLLDVQNESFPEQIIDWDHVIDELIAIDSNRTTSREIKKPLSSEKNFRYLVKYSMAGRISAIGLRQWRDDITNEIETTKVAFRSFRATIQSKISEYEASYQELKEAATMIELVLWKNKISEARKVINEEGGSRKKMKLDESAIREQCRSRCGANIVIENVLPYLLPGSSNSEENNLPVQ